MRRCAGGFAKGRRNFFCRFHMSSSSSTTPAAAAVTTMSRSQRTWHFTGAESGGIGRSMSSGSADHHEESLAWARRERPPLLWKPEEWDALMRASLVNWESSGDSQSSPRPELFYDGWLDEGGADWTASAVEMWEEEDAEEETCLYKTWLDSWGSETTSAGSSSGGLDEGLAQREHALYQKQMEIEHETLRHAEEAYKELSERMVDMGGAAKLKPVERLLVAWFQPLVEKITGDRSATLLGDTSGYKKRYGPLLMLLPPTQFALITMHTVIGRCLKAGRDGEPFTALVLAIAEGVQTEVRMLKLRKKYEDELDEIELSRRAQSALATTKDGKEPAAGRRRRAVDPETIVQGLSPHLVNWKARKLLLEEDDADWPLITRAKLGAALLDMFINVCEECAQSSGMFRISTVTKSAPLRGEPYMTQSVVKAGPELLGLVATSDVAKDALMPRYLPMLIEPSKWRGYDGGGYLMLRAVLMRTNGSLSQVKAVRKAETLMPDFVDALDALGRVPWKINKAVLNVVQQCWDSKIEMPYVPSQYDHEIPEEPVIADGTDEEEARKTKQAWRRRVKKLEQKNSELHSLRCDLLIKLSIANKFADEEKIYFPYNVDFRGRTYPIPPNLNHLGSDVCRGMLTFAEAKPLGERGFYWLRVHLANLFGLSKKSLDERAAFADDNLQKILAVADDPLGERWWLEADDAWQALAACFEIAAAYRHPGGISEYECSLPVHADGSCNGLQHYASLGRDEEGGRQVNLLPGDRPLDVYSGVCDMIVKRVDEIVASKGVSEKSGKDPESAAENLRLAALVSGMINRKVVKQTVMTSVYGVTFIGARDQVHARIEEIVEGLVKAPPSEERDAQLSKFKRLGLIDKETGEIDEKTLRKCSTFVAHLTLDGIAELFTSARLIMTWFADCASLIARDGQAVSWITPLGLPVVQPYRSHSSYQVKTVLQKIVLIDNSENLPVSVARNKSAFPPNFVHSLDSTHMLMTAAEMDKRNLTFAAVHDSYWTHATNMDDMQATLRRAFLDLYQQPILEQLNESFQLRYPHLNFPPLPPRGKLDINKILEADYFFS